MRFGHEASWMRQNGDHEDLQDIPLSDVPNRRSGGNVSRGQMPECIRGRLHEICFVTVIALAAATPIFLQRSTVVITASIANALQMSPAELAWTTAGSGLTTGAFLLPFGHIADTCTILSRQTLLVTSLFAFSLLVGVACLAPNGIVLDILSSLAGIASAANIPIAIGILSLAYPLPSRRKNIVYSSFLMGTPAATIIGGLGSGGLAKHISWKAPFICLAFLYAVVSVLAWLLVPNVAEPDAIQKDLHDDILGPRRLDGTFVEAQIGSESFASPGFDWLGVCLLTAGILLFTVSLTIGPEGPEPWKTPTVICLLTFGVMCLGCFVVWETATKTPMVPPCIWGNMCIVLVILCTLFASMASYSQVFWISMFMQQLENLSPLDVAVRLLPQALVGLLFSPLVGLILHRVPGSTLLMVAASALVLSNLPLIFLRQGSSYFAWIMPALMLSTVGMDWIINISSLHMLALLPLHHHSAGASLLQIAARLGVPFGMATTTAIWSSYDGRGDTDQLQTAYANTFSATAGLAGVCLLLVPFIKIGRQGNNQREEIESDTDSIKPDCAILAEESLDKSHRPSKRWSLGDTFSQTSSIMGDRTRRAPSLTMSLASSTNKSTDNPKAEHSSDRSTLPRSQAPIVWMVCEDCGSRRRERVNEKARDPARYFNDVSDQSVRPYPSRRRFPMANRQILTHQMLTQGFEPFKDQPFKEQSPKEQP